MINAIYTSIIGGSFFKGPGNSGRNISHTSLDGPRKAKLSIEGRGRASEIDAEEAKASESSYGIQEAHTLFTEVDQADYIDKIPQLIVAQRSYEAALKSFQTEDEITKEALISILA